MKLCVVLLLLISFLHNCVAQAASLEEINSHVQAARTAEQKGDHATAIREYSYLAHQLPDVAEIQNNLGIAYYQNREPALALASLQRAHTLNSGLYSPVLFSGLALYQLGRYDQATRLLRESCLRNPHDPLAHSWLARTLVALSEYDEASKELDAALHLDPNDQDLLYLEYKVQLLLGERDTRKLIEQSPDGARVWQLAADQWGLLGNKEKSAALYREAESRQSDLSVHLNTAEDRLFWSASEHESKSQKAAEKLLRIAPDGARQHQISAEAFLAQSRFDDAIHEYRKALHGKADLAEVHLAIGDLLLRTGHPSDALHEYDAELKLIPGEWAVYFHEGLAFMMLDEEEHALSSFLTARRSGVNTPQLHVELGKLFLRRHDFKSAINELSEYVAKVPTEPQGHYLLMMAYRGSGNIPLVRQQQQLFEKYSIDIKKRSLAERELGDLQSNREAPVLPESHGQIN